MSSQSRCSTSRSYPTKLSELIAVWMCNGYVLLPPKREANTNTNNFDDGSAPWKKSEQLHEHLRSAMAAVRREDTTRLDTVMTSAEKECATLVESDALSCFKFMSEDRGVDWVLRNVKRDYGLSFYGESIPEMPLKGYIREVLLGTQPSAQATITAMVYLARLVQRGVMFTCRSAHRMFIAAIIVAAKLQDDLRNHSFLHYARVGGISPTRLHRLELELMKALDHRLHVTKEEYSVMVFSLLSCQYQLNPAQFGKAIDSVAHVPLTSDIVEEADVFGALTHGRMSDFARKHSETPPMVQWEARTPSPQSQYLNVSHLPLAGSSLRRCSADSQISVGSSNFSWCNEGNESHGISAETKPLEHGSSRSVVDDAQLACPGDEGGADAHHQHHHQGYAIRIYEQIDVN